MFAPNTEVERDSLALKLVQDFGLSFRTLQVALELCTESDAALDVVLLWMGAVSKEDLAIGAASCGFHLSSSLCSARPRPQGTRVFARYACAQPLELVAGQSSKLAHAHNVSRGGLGVTVDRTDELPVGTRVEVVLSVSDKALRLRGSVCYGEVEADRLRVGIQIHPRDAKEVLQMDRLLRQAQDSEVSAQPMH